LKNDLAF
jgi:hypothetical protein